ncbi:protein far1-related sequence 5-like [Gigaspora margarita]|uniref:Protein far1-related sequence 5-like n=1 Tax=Gigaspora margarita TaxID=4874 RepID=A0A8H4EUB1_GIGMA|nr:protein far1-related sequence 5-like [Gigaspora margarita]
MIEFLELTEYLLRQLDSCKTTWAKAFSGQVFTTGITFTQRRLFPNVYSILQKYVTPKILQLHVDQMNEAVMYNGQKINFDDLFDLILDTVENGPIELEYDFCQIHIDELLEGIDRSLIAKVWEVHSIENKLSVGQHIVLLKNGFHLCTCILLIDSGVNEIMDALVNNKLFVKGKSQENNDSTLDASNIPLFSNVAESWNTVFIELSEQTTAKVIGRKQSVKGTLLGLARKCVELVDYDNPRDSDNLMEMFKEWIFDHKRIQSDKEVNMLRNIEHDHASENVQVTESEQVTEGVQVIEDVQVTEDIQVVEDFENCLKLKLHLTESCTR